MQGGVDAISTLLRVVVQGRTPSPVVLHGLRVTVVSRNQPIDGIYVTFQPDLGGIPVRLAIIDLDTQPPTLSFEDGLKGNEERFPLQVSQEEVEVFDILAVSSDCDCAWYLSLDFESGGKQGSITIDDHGHPFRTVVPGGIPDSDRFQCFEGGAVSPGP